MWNCEMSMLDVDKHGWMLGPMYNMHTGQLMVRTHAGVSLSCHDIVCCFRLNDQANEIPLASELYAFTWLSTAQAQLSSAQPAWLTAVHLNLNALRCRR